MSPFTPLYFLSGPTASGKTSVAHHLAEKMGLRLLSVDSMMVYRQMDIGTAKPTDEEIAAYHYAGLNLAEPGEDFSTGKWLRTISKELDDRPTLAVGGTGLYFRAVIDGLPPESAASNRLEVLSAENLRAKIKVLDADALNQLADPWNPRRLERALQRLESGNPLPKAWADRAGFPVAVLRRPVEKLNQRIHQRAEKMFQEGLLEETQLLLNQGNLVGTAAQAIGYREAQAILENRLGKEEALEALATRTRRYAKRQRTWFRNQMDSKWVDIESDSTLENITDKVAEIWQDCGPFPFDRNLYV
jgi:tRNA dimethylallyltransferase